MSYLSCLNVGWQGGIEYADFDSLVGLIRFGERGDAVVLAGHPVIEGFTRLPEEQQEQAIGLIFAPATVTAQAGEVLSRFAIPDFLRGEV